MKSDMQRLQEKAAFCVLILQKLLSDASDHYIEEEAKKMMCFSDGVIVAMVKKLCPDYKKELANMAVYLNEDSLIPVILKRKIDWRREDGSEKSSK